MLEYVWTFVVGGLICVVAQILIDKTAMTGARILVSFVVIGVILSGFGVYQRVVDFAGAGATVPIVGFGHALAEGTKKAVDETGLLGALTGGLTGTSAGITAAVVLAFIWSLLFKSRQK